MIDHITLHVRDVAQSHTFYAAALKPLGYIDKVRHGDTIGMGVNDGTPRADFYLSPTDDSDEDQSTTPITHIAFRAQSQQEVKDFYSAALAAGGTDNGKPGPRNYHPGYFAAFVLDPDGNNIEAVMDWANAKTAE